jgi:hypothetical protein
MKSMESMVRPSPSIHTYHFFIDFINRKACARTRGLKEAVHRLHLHHRPPGGNWRIASLAIDFID